MLLKEIKSVLPDMLRAKEQLRAKRKALAEKSDSLASPAEISLQNGKFADLEALLTSAMRNVLLENNKILEDNICKEVTEKVAKDMDFLLQAKERQEDERFRRLDHLIRQQQSIRREAAKPAPARYLRKVLGEY